MPDLFYHTQLSSSREGTMSYDPTGGAKFSFKRGARSLSKAGKTLTTRRQRRVVGDAAAARVAGVITTGRGAHGKIVRKTKKAVKKTASKASSKTKEAASKVASKAKAIVSDAEGLLSKEGKKAIGKLKDGLPVGTLGGACGH